MHIFNQPEVPLMSAFKFLHIFNQPEVPLMSAFKLFVDTFVSFQKREVIIILPCNENSLRFINYNSRKDKKEKVAQWK